MQRQDLSLDVVRPEDVPVVLGAAVREFRKAAGEVRVRWKNPEVGGMWETVANILEDTQRRVKMVTPKFRPIG